MAPITSFDLVIFDCDGVLVDSEVITNRVFAEMLAEFGLTSTTVVRSTTLNLTELAASLSELHASKPKARRTASTATQSGRPLFDPFQHTPFRYAARTARAPFRVKCRCASEDHPPVESAARPHHSGSASLHTGCPSQRSASRKADTTRRVQIPESLARMPAGIAGFDEIADGGLPGDGVTAGPAL